MRQKPRQKLPSARSRSPSRPRRLRPSQRRLLLLPLSQRLAFPGAYSRLKRRPDQASAAILLHSIEAGLVTKPSPVSYPQPPASSDTTTDEPEDTAERDASRSPSYVPPPANEIVRNVTIAAITAPAHQNVSVHNKSVRQPEVMPLEAAALDAPALRARSGEGRASRARAPGESGSPANADRRRPAPEPERPAQPGPFHIQAGAFTDEAQAKERLESVKEALGAEILKAHPDFIMRVTLGNGTTMYRARLGRFVSEAQASVACKRLKKSGIDCWGIPVD